MTTSPQITAKYDAFSDVMYVSTKKAPANRGIEDENGIVWRYDDGGRLIGATIVDMQDFWCAQRFLLEKEISEHFGISAERVRFVLAEAFSPWRDR